jgi:hypothetical protein
MTDQKSDQKTGKTGGADTHKFKMKPKPGSPPGLETDGHGKVIPLAQRTADDRAKVNAAHEKSAGEKES